MILLDTCTLLWLVLEPAKLSPKAKALLADPATALPPHHNAPFDRLLVATAQHHHFTLFTPAPKIHLYPDVKLVW